MPQIRSFRINLAIVVSIAASLVLLGLVLTTRNLEDIVAPSGELKETTHLTGDLVTSVFWMQENAEAAFARLKEEFVPQGWKVERPYDVMRLVRYDAPGVAGAIVTVIAGKRSLKDTSFKPTPEDESWSTVFITRKNKPVWADWLDSFAKPDLNRH